MKRIAPARTIRIVVLLLAAAQAAPAPLLAADDPPALPLRVRAGARELKPQEDFHPGDEMPGPWGPRYGSGFLSITIDSWSNGDDVAAMSRDLASGGLRGLMSAMDKRTVGSVQVNTNLKIAIRLATTWTVRDIRSVVLAIVGPVELPGAKPLRNKDSIITLIDFRLPPGEPGEGSLVYATKLGFDDQGRIEAIEWAPDAKEVRLMDVEIEPRRREGK